MPEKVTENCFSKTKYQPQSLFIEECNAFLKDFPLPGKIISMENVFIKKSKNDEIR